MRYEVLICSLEERAGFLDRLLACLAPQLTEDVLVTVCRDGGQMGVGDKRNRLLAHAEADYVSFVDDDDLVADDFVERVLKAIDVRQPDYVGFYLQYYIEGTPHEKLTKHSIEFQDWSESEELFQRSVSHLNPLRRSIASQFRFRNGLSEDFYWSQDVYLSGRINTQVMLDLPVMYHYLWQTKPIEMPSEEAVDHPRVRYI